MAKKNKKSEKPVLGSSLQLLVAETEIENLINGLGLFVKDKIAFDEVLATITSTTKLYGYVTLNGLTISTTEDVIDEAGVSVYGDEGEWCKFDIGNDMQTKGDSIYFFKTPMIWGTIVGREWTFHKELEDNFEQNYKSEMCDCQAQEIINGYWQWCESLKEDLQKILTNLNITGEIF